MEENRGWEPLVVRVEGSQPPYAYIAESWPKQIAIHDEAMSSPFIQLWAEQRGFHLTLTNGHAQYRFKERMPNNEGWVCDLVSLTHTEGDQAAEKGKETNG